MEESGCAVWVYLEQPNVLVVGDEGQTFPLSKDAQHCPVTLDLRDLQQIGQGGNAANAAVSGTCRRRRPRWSRTRTRHIGSGCPYACIVARPTSGRRLSPSWVQGGATCGGLAVKVARTAACNGRAGLDEGVAPLLVPRHLVRQLQG